MSAGYLGTCLHEQFTAIVHVGRLTKEDGGPVVNFVAEVTVRCADCKRPFRFKGLPWGVLNDVPTTDVTGQELRAPIEQAEDHEIPERPLQRGRFEMPR